ncbi:MAG: flavoprotein [Polyangiaceae bacterium]
MHDAGERLVTSAVASIIEREGALLAGAYASALRFEGDSVPFVAATLELLRVPRSRAELRAELSAMAGGGSVDAALEDTLRALLAARVVEIASAGRRASTPLAGVHLVLGSTGAIATADVPRLVRELQRLGAVVRVALTRAAHRFVSIRVLEALTHAPVVGAMFSRDPSAPAPHIELARWADVVVIAPASATTIARITSGDSSDVVAATAIATAAPVLLAPSMNDRMWSAPSTRRNVATLVRDGHAILQPAAGVEVADAPDARRAMSGAALTAENLARAVATWVEHDVRPRAVLPIDWDAVYASEREPVFHRDDLDETLAAALSAHAPPPARLLDAGCGLGAQARALAARGYVVTAVDVSRTALARALSSARGSGVLFLEDDLVKPRFVGEFDAILDRGTLHGLPARDRATYAANLARFTRASGVVIVVRDTEAASASFSTARISAEELRALFPDFELVEERPATLRRGESDRAIVAVLRRRPATPLPAAAPSA